MSWDWLTSGRVKYFKVWLIIYISPRVSTHWLRGSDTILTTSFLCQWASQLTFSLQNANDTSRWLPSVVAYVISHWRSQVTPSFIGYWLLLRFNMIIFLEELSCWWALYYNNSWILMKFNKQQINCPVINEMTKINFLYGLLW